jgi:hypothetical protein
MYSRGGVVHNKDILGGENLPLQPWRGKQRPTFNPPWAVFASSAQTKTPAFLPGFRISWIA